MVICVVDCGTSKVRAMIARDQEVISTHTVSVGASMVASTGGKALLRDGIRVAISEALRMAGLEEADLDGVVSVGLGSSELGLSEIPHLTAPVSCQDLADAVRTEFFEDIISRPFHLIPGVRNRVMVPGLEHLAEVDSMRGEETQVIGAIKVTGIRPPCLLLFLSSHTKLVRVDAEGRIAESITTLSGQVFRMLRGHTIVASALSCLPDEASADLSLEMVLRGYRFEKEQGFLRAVLMPRCMLNLVGTPPLERLAFLEGALVASDMDCLRHLLVNNPPHRLLILGQVWRSRVYQAVLAVEAGSWISESRVMTPREADEVTVRGALEILSCRRELLRPSE